ncbi:unnamed protein product [Pleuronectes platessa]|uniref:Uncharacterized protein n=1 Tax=Pleuronectes platessa TaxID=8262 RepID=A0A9N7UWG6_PLEPL|nr:unnamed protein product [Pleuronectes platessa]
MLCAASCCRLLRRGVSVRYCWAGCATDAPFSNHHGTGFNHQLYIGRNTAISLEPINANSAARGQRSRTGHRPSAVPKLVPESASVSPGVIHGLACTKPRSCHTAL